MKFKADLIILAAGTMHHDFIGIFNSSPAMLPFCGKPLIYDTLLSFIDNFSGNVVVALPTSEKRIEKFLKCAFGGRLNLKFVYPETALKDQQTLTLKQCLDRKKEEDVSDSPLLVIHGDIHLDFKEVAAQLLKQQRKSAAFVQKGFKTDKYSYFVKDIDNKNITHENKWTKNKNIWMDCGIYYFPSWHELLEKQISPSNIGTFLVREFQENINLKPIKKWLDLGVIDSATSIYNKVLGTREFNSLKIDELTGGITKESKKNVKLLQEINYYLKIPKGLSFFFPRLFEFNLGLKNSYTIEYYPYKTVSEYFVMYELSEACWRNFFDHLFKIYSEFGEYKQLSFVNAEKVYDFYNEKLDKRIIELRAQSNKRILALLDLECLKVNGKRYGGLESTLKYIKEKLKRLSKRLRPSVIHGDLCFSNILFDPATNIIKFIDPRGDFFDEGPYGDPRYDWAKLLHSIHGCYDYLLMKMYRLQEVSEGCFNFEIFSSESTELVQNLFFDYLKKKFDFIQINDLLVMEAMLFITMLPLHKDDEERQIAFFLTALKIIEQAKQMEESKNADLL